MRKNRTKISGLHYTPIKAKTENSTPALATFGINIYDEVTKPISRFARVAVTI
jgi:hypothetical protein